MKKDIYLTSQTGVKFDYDNHFGRNNRFHFIQCNKSGRNNTDRKFSTQHFLRVDGEYLLKLHKFLSARFIKDASLNKKKIWLLGNILLLSIKTSEKR